MEVEWLSLPHPLLAEFLERAEEEASQISSLIEKLAKSVNSARSLISGLIEPLGEGKVIRVGAVDGSRSPKLSERMGARYGLIAAGALIIEGERRISEKYIAGQFKRKQALSGEVSKYFFDLLSVYAERKIALEILDDVDLLFIDGSFYSFVYPVLRMRKQGLFGEREEEIFREVYEMTRVLSRSKKVIGVIKRSHTRAIGGFIALNSIEELKDLITVIDKLILSAIMPPKTIFRYERLIGDENVSVYTQAAYLASKSMLEDLMERAREKAYEPFRKLGLDLDDFRSLRRAQVKAHASTPVCELEHPSIDLEVWEDLFSDATGLPVAIDLIDSSVSLSSKLTDEYVSEVEARVLERLKDKEMVRWFFHFLNPQKIF
jgi:hypothetical protein